jgi:flagellar protein FlbD
VIPGGLLELAKPSAIGPLLARGSPASMITLSRLNGQVVAINPDLITWIEVTPDTIVSLVGGEKLIVREGLEDVISRIIGFRRAIGGGAPVHDGVLERVSRPPSDRPPSLGSSTSAWRK